MESRGERMILSQRGMIDRSLGREGVCEYDNIRKGFLGMSKIIKILYGILIYEY